MTKSKLADSDKQWLVDIYSRGNHTMKEVAEKFDVSVRTVGRILVEYGADTPVIRARSELSQIKKVLKKHNLEVHDLDLALTGAISTNTVFEFLKNCSDAKLTYILDMINKARVKTVHTNVTTQSTVRIHAGN